MKIKGTNTRSERYDISDSLLFFYDDSRPLSKFDVFIVVRHLEVLCYLYKTHRFPLEIHTEVQYLF